MIKKIKRWWGKRGQGVPAPREVTAAQLDDRFLAAPDNPLWEAVLAVLAEKINTTGTDAANEQLTDRQILWRVAGVDALMQFMEDLQEREQKARERRTEDGSQREE